MDLREDYAEHFLRYEPFQSRLKPEPASAPRTTAPTPATQAPTASGASKVTVEWLRENYPLLEQRAMDDPSPVNVRAAAYVKRIVLDKASRYANAMQQAVLADPLLNENSRVPYAHTTFKEQGATNKHQLIMVSETGARIFNKEAAYVAATRAKVNTEVITSDREELLRNAGKDVSKLMALQPTEMKQLVEQARSGRSGAEQQRAPDQTPQKAQRVQELHRD